MTDYSELVKSLRYYHENGLFAAVRAGMDFSGDEAATAIETLTRELEEAKYEVAKFNGIIAARDSQLTEQTELATKYIAKWNAAETDLTDTKARLAEAVEELRHTSVFIRTRERMRPIGIQMFDDCLAKQEADQG